MTAVALTLCLFNHHVLAQTKLADRKMSTTAQQASFRDCPTCPEMVAVPGGTFRMGAGDNEAKGFLEEVPQHRVHIKSLAVSRFDITRGEWKEFVNATSRSTNAGCGYSGLPKEERSKASWDYLGFPQDDRHPVVCVTFQDASDYAKWLSRKTGHGYRLLSEAEWEYAARAGTSTPFPWGTTASHEYANYGTDDRPGPGLSQGRDAWIGTSPVGSFPPNAFGLYDMHGNVLQWVEDCFSNGYAAASNDGLAYQEEVSLSNLTGNVSSMNGTTACSYRMLRGGDWGDPPNMIRSAFRNFAPSPGQSLATYRSAGLGIRIARDDR